jgi:hypothetical protein
MARLLLYIVLTFSTIWLLTACVDPIDEQAIIDARITKKTTEYAERRIKECRSEAHEQAETYVDSLIANYVGTEVIDTFTFPDRPVRPSRPDAIIGTVKKFEVEK